MADTNCPYCGSKSNIVHTKVLLESSHLMYGCGERRYKCIDKEHVFNIFYPVPPKEVKKDFPNPNTGNLKVNFQEGNKGFANGCVLTVNQQYAEEFPDAELYDESGELIPPPEPESEPEEGPKSVAESESEKETKAEGGTIRDKLIALILKVLHYVMNFGKITDKPEPEPDCPICGSEWWPGDIFCYLCGYEKRELKYILHPPPARTGGLTDPDGVLDGTVRDKLSSEIEDIGKSSNFDFAVVVASKRMSIKMSRMNVSSEAIGYCLYNSWMLGKKIGNKGLLYLIDPWSKTRALIMGLSGPSINGKSFRSWYEATEPESVETPHGKRLEDEIRTLTGQLSGAQETRAAS